MVLTLGNDGSARDWKPDTDRQTFTLRLPGQTNSTSTAAPRPPSRPTASCWPSSGRLAVICADSLPFNSFQNSAAGCRS